jgi:hypothetical protein
MELESSIKNSQELCTCSCPEIEQSSTTLKHKKMSMCDFQLVYGYVPFDIEAYLKIILYILKRLYTGF